MKCPKCETKIIIKKQEVDFGDFVSDIYFLRCPDIEGCDFFMLDNWKDDLKSRFFRAVEIKQCAMKK